MQPARNATLSEQKLANEARASAGVARDALVLLKQALDESADSAGTRHVRLRAAMLDLMARRIWGPGDKLPREREIADAVAEGLSNAEIGARLFCSEATVKTHLTHVFAKIGDSNRVRLALLVRDASA